MKVAVYAIALNEERFVEQWSISARDADCRLICDTGSTDETGFLASTAIDKSRIHYIHVKPWRFDIARNAALALVPADIDVCIALDMDEELKPGWREALERAWKPETTRLRHPFAFKQNPDGTPSQIMYGHRIHGRHDYFWRYPIHECLTPSGNRVESIAWCDDLWIHHHESAKPTRAKYLGWMEAAAREDPTCERMAFYYARELMYNGRWSDAVAEFNRYLSLPKAATWKEQRCEAMRYAGRCANQIEKGRGLDWFLKACMEDRTSRQAWYENAKALMEVSDWAGGYWAAQNAMGCDPRPRGEIYDVKDMDAGPFDVGGVCAFYLGLRDRADDWIRKAAAICPDDPRLQKNLEFCSGASAA